MYFYKCYKIDSKNEYECSKYLFRDFYDGGPKKIISHTHLFQKILYLGLYLKFLKKNIFLMF